MDYCEDGDWLETAVYTDKRDYDTEAVVEFKDVSTVSELVTDNRVCDGLIEEIVESDDIVADVNTVDKDLVKATELTVEKQAEQIATTIQKYYKSYAHLSVENKARLFNFKLDDNSYNLELYGLVLKKLGIHMYGSEGFEDYQSIYEETMKTAEKQGSEFERGYENKRYENKRYERGRGR